MHLPLEGIQVLVTRPAHQARQFQELLLDVGAKPTLFPVMAIEPVKLAPTSLLKITEQVYDWVIFISANAVEYGLGFFSNYSSLQTVKLGAIGKQTAAALEKYGLKVAVVPDTGFTSEDFLALNELQNLVGQKVLIVRGQTGRELLGESLQARGAELSYATVYKRSVLGSASDLKQIQVTQELDIICVTSSEILRNLLQLAQPDTWIYQQVLLVGSERIATYAQQLGFKKRIIVAASPADHDMLAALIKWQQDTEE